MTNCCDGTVPHTDGKFEPFATPGLDWAARLTEGLGRRMRASDETMGDLEKQIVRQTQGLERKVLEEAS
jgi:hypothetical protein